MEPVAHVTPRRPLRVLVVDGDRRVRRSLCGLIDVADGLETAGAAADPAGAMAGLSSSPVDLVLLDPRLPDLDAGRALVSAIQRDWPGTSIVVLWWPGEPPSGVLGAVTVAPGPVAPDSLVDLLHASAAGRAQEGRGPLS